MLRPQSSLLLLAALCAIGCKKSAPVDAETLKNSSPEGVSVAAITLRSENFAGGADIPSDFTCEGKDLSPHLAWGALPANTKSLVLIIDDPDAPDPAAPKTVYAHGLLYNLSPTISSIHYGEFLAQKIDPNAQDGRNDFGKVGYGGPCPPIGKHRYFFKLYALDVRLGDLKLPNKAQLEQAMLGHVLGYGELIGTYQKKGPSDK